MRDRVATRYELRERLGTSATATVWRARDRQRRQDVALKVANHQPADVVSRRQLAAEADAAGRLDHPNIVPLLDAHLGHGEAALAFRYVGGETLARHLAIAGRLIPAEAAAIAIDIADALAHAHRRGVVHRDVKPGNVMIGSDGRARLFDFGISATPQRIDGGLPGPGLTSGTLPYMAPEQLAGRPADPASDVYALGAVLYEMLAGRRPYPASTTEELARQHRLPTAPVDGAPAELVDLAIAALGPDPGARPGAATVARRLRAWQARQADAPTEIVNTVPTTAIVPAIPAAPPRPALRRPPLISLVAGALVVIGLVAGSLAFAAGLNQPVATPPAATFAPGSAVDIPTLAPTPAPANGTSGGGNQGGSGGHGDNGNHGSGSRHGHGNNH